MKRLIKFGAIGLVTFGAIAGEVSAQVGTRYEDADGVKIFEILGTPRTQVPLIIEGETITATKQIKVDGCGFYVLTNASSYNTVAFDGGANSTLGTTLASAVRAKPTCLNGVSSTADRQINLGDNKVLINSLARADAPNGRTIDFRYTQTGNKTKYVTLNECGAASVKLLPGAASIYLTLNGGTRKSVDSFPNTYGKNYVCVGDKAAIKNVISTGQVFKTSLGVLTMKKALAGDIHSFKIDGGTQLPIIKSATSDRCGALRIPNSGSSITIKGTVINPTALPVGLAPNCILNTSGNPVYDVTPTGIVKTSDDRIFIPFVPASPTGFGNRTLQNYSIPSEVGFKDYVSDACGLVRVPQTTPPYTGVYTSPSTLVTLASIPTKDVSCNRTTGTTFITPAL